MDRGFQWRERVLIASSNGLVSAEDARVHHDAAAAAAAAGLAWYLSKKFTLESVGKRLDQVRKKFARFIESGVCGAQPRPWLVIELLATVNE